MASTRVAPLARWSVAAAVALVGAALLVTAWTTRASVRDARDTLLRGERMAMEQAVHADLTELGAPPTSDDLAALLVAHQGAGLRYIAMIGPDGQVTASAGESSSSGDRVRIEVRGARRAEGARGGGLLRGFDGRAAGAGATGGLGSRHAGRAIVELEPVEAESLDAATARVLETGLAAAVVLMIVAAFLFRWLLRREQLERVRERDRRLVALGELSAVLAHEIRNPLASLKGNAQLLAASLPGGEKPRAKAERVVEEAVRLETLTNDLLDYVRTGEIRRAPADPAALLRACAESIAVPDEPASAPATGAADGAAEEAGRAARPPAIELVTNGAPPSWPFDEARVRQVLVNLLDNAVAAGPPVRAVVTVSGGNLVYEISDHGPGIPAGDVERIFEPFFTKKTRGTGLGLAVVRRVVESHGGTITAGAAPGGGARFRVELPRG